MMGRMTLRTRLVMLVVAAIVPLFGLSIFKAWVDSDAAIKRATANLQFAVSLVAANQARVAESAHQLLISIANMPGLTSEKSLDCQRYFKTLREKFSIYANLGIIGVDGYASPSANIGAPQCPRLTKTFEDVVDRRARVRRSVPGIVRRPVRKASQRIHLMQQFSRLTHAFIMAEPCDPGEQGGTKHAHWV